MLGGRCGTGAGLLFLLFAMAVLVATARLAVASTDVVYLPLDDPIYDELDTLDSLGYLDDSIDEIKSTSRVEAVRLAIEVRHQVSDSLPLR
jgi:hypothetical protein